MDYQALSDEELVRECAEGSRKGHSCEEAWTEFRRRFHRLIAGVVIKAFRVWSGNLQSGYEDLIQDTYLKLWNNDCSLLVGCKPRHPDAFRGFLKTVAANVVYDHFRAEHADKRNVASTVELNESVNQIQSGYGHQDTVDMDLFFDGVDRVLRQRGNGPTEQKERTIFWLYYRQGFTAKQIASIPAMNLSVKGVESVIYRLTAFVRKALGFDQSDGASTGN
jgi:RNA polymerase sigma-70 factor, ECF subfamily